MANQQWVAGDSVRDTYDSYASVYDDFNRGYMYERWTGRLLGVAEEAGLEGNRLLDVACGTGLSFLPMLDRGWEVTGCDISPAMLEIAREKADGRADLMVADMRDLPDLGEFDLVWAVNDPLNYLLSYEELVATMKSLRRNLAPSGFVLFDINTLVTYRTFFSQEIVVEENGKQMMWQGKLKPDQVSPGVLAEAHFTASGGEGTNHVHRQRHFAQEEVLAAHADAGLGSVRMFGELDGALTEGVDENLHTKAVYLSRSWGHAYC